MAEFPYPPTPCSEGTTMIHAIRCVPVGEGTEWQDFWILATELSAGTARVGGCGGGGCAKTEAIKTARERGWSADELVKVLKLLG